VASLEESRRTVHSDIYDTGIALIDSWLGRALVDSGRDRVRGRQLVIRAWPVLAADKNAEDEAADLAAWMKAHQMATSR
jgi:hypothetical protein